MLSSVIGGVCPFRDNVVAYAEFGSVGITAAVLVRGGNDISS